MPGPSGLTPITGSVQRTGEFAIGSPGRLQVLQPVVKLSLQIDYLLLESGDLSLQLRLLVSSRTESRSWGLQPPYRF